ncbi:MAG: hypothetical protein HFI13_10995 [Lachnospiraceae bacterium]|jgi:hypothetical protein|nr:hypothetical protein [Lachnospiraceae bacterium]
MEFVLLPRTYRRAKFMRIQSIITTWDRQARAYLAVVTFELTQHVWNCKPIGHKLYTCNVETLARLLEDLSLLYAPSKALAVPLPDFEDESLHYSRILPDVAEKPVKT